MTIPCKYSRHVRQNWAARAARAAAPADRPWPGAEFNAVVHAVRAVATRPRGRPWALPLPSRILIVCVSLRTNLTERALAAVFTTSQSAIDRTVRALTPALAALLTPPATDRGGTWIIDGTLIPVHDHTRSAISKNYRRSVNTQLVVRQHDRLIVAVGQAWPGNRNDIIVARETLTEVLRDAPARVLADGAYRSLPGVITPPARHEPARRRAHRTARAVVEHVLARLKDWQILRQCRRKGNAIDDALHAVAYLYNLRRQLRVNS